MYIYMWSDISWYLNIAIHANFQWSHSSISFRKCSNQCFTNGLWQWTSLLFFFFLISNLSWTEISVEYNSNDILEKWNNIRSKTQNTIAFLIILISKYFKIIRFHRCNIPWQMSTKVSKCLLYLYLLLGAIMVCRQAPVYYCPPYLNFHKQSLQNSTSLKFTHCISYKL